MGSTTSHRSSTTRGKSVPKGLPRKSRPLDSGQPFREVATGDVVDHTYRRTITAEGTASAAAPTGQIAVKSPANHESKILAEQHGSGPLLAG